MLCEADAALRFAPIGVLSHVERDAINHELTVRVTQAETHGRSLDESITVIQSSIANQHLQLSSTSVHHQSLVRRVERFEQRGRS